MKEKRLRRSKTQKIILRPTYYQLHFSINVAVTTNKLITTLFHFIISYLQKQIDVVR